MKVTILAFTAFAVCSCCPSGWVKFENSCYKFEHNNRKTWQDAKNQCISMHAFLAKIYNARANNFIRGELKKLHPGSSNTDQFWTAGNDLQREGHFVWAGTNDSIVEYTDWSPGEPNQNGGEEDCMAFFPMQDYHWNDEHCNLPEFFICEQREGKGSKCNKGSFKRLSCNYWDNCHLRVDLKPCLKRNNEFFNKTQFTNFGLKADKFGQLRIKPYCTIKAYEKFRHVSQCNSHRIVETNLAAGMSH